MRAPDRVSAGVHRLVEQMASAPAVPRTSIHVDYWLVVGMEDKESNAQSIETLTPVLQSIEKMDGPRRFKVLEHLATNSSSGQEVAIIGGASRAKTTAMTLGDTVRLRTEFQSRLGEVKADTQVKNSDYLILGQKCLRGRSERRRCSRRSRRVFLVPRTSII